VVALHAADGDERVAAFGDGVGDEVFEFSDFVAAVGETAVFGLVGVLWRDCRIATYLLQSSRFAHIFTSPFGDSSFVRRGRN
jgi:hypothetical protein